MQAVIYDAKMVFLAALGLASLAFASVVFCAYLLESWHNVKAFWHRIQKITQKIAKNTPNLSKYTQKRASLRNIDDKSLYALIEQHFTDHPQSHSQMSTARAVADAATCAERERCASIVAEVWTKSRVSEVDEATQQIINKIYGG